MKTAEQMVTRIWKDESIKIPKRNKAEKEADEKILKQIKEILK